MNPHMLWRDQSRRASLIEAIANTVIGYIVAYLATYAIVWAYDMPMTHGHVSAMVNWMTLLSVLRGYVLRRLWNAEFWKRWSWRHPFVLQPRPAVCTLRHITIPPDALLGVRPLTIEEQREVLWRLRETNAHSDYPGIPCPQRN
jgi:hypothetical protein